MNTCVHPENALEAVVAASRANGTILQRPLAPERESNPRGVGQQGLPAVDRAGVALLGRLLMLRATAGTPIFQFAACAAGDDIADVAGILAHTSAVLVGRTLNIRTDPPLTGHLYRAGPAAKPLLDGLLPRLYHLRTDTCVAAGALPDGAARSNALADLARQFRLVVVASSDCAASFALAPLCTGTVLTVRAGQTRIADIQAMSARIESTGGRVLGTVLSNRVARRGAL